jgi:multimeric flavodoxin WrbA
MYTIGISGSPREEGNTAILVKEVLKHIRGEKRFISLAGLNINPCDSCDRCWKEGIECVIDDDIRWILRELERCDAVILGSPTYFGMVSAQLKMLIDRTVSLHEKDTFKNKVGAAVVTNDIGSRGGQLVVEAIAQFLIPENIYAGGVIGEGGAEMGHVKKDQKALQRAKELAKRIMELVEMIKGE